MSILFFIIFIGVIKGMVDPTELNFDFLLYWALFAISDALWLDLLKKAPIEKLIEYLSLPRERGIRT